MPAFNDNQAHLDSPSYHAQILILLGGLLLVRIGLLLLSPYNLHGDEAQYWAWSKALDWGYFTKPPGIAVVIAATTSLFGDSEWAVRLSSPLLHTITAYIIYRTGRILFSGATGFWAASIFILMPAVWLSSAIVSTDVPLLLCWAVALNAWVHLRRRPSWMRTLQLGLAIGLGLLCKYAMLFFIPGLMCAIIFDMPSRRALLNLKGLVIGIIILALLTPNMIWNLNNEFATLSHTAANANMQDGPSIHIEQLIEFFLSQLAVFGPVTFILFLLAVLTGLQKRLNPPALLLIIFACTPLIVIMGQALISRANANWAVTSYVAASILTAHFAVKYWPKLRPWLSYGVIGQSFICLLAGIIYMNPIWVNELGRANDVKRVRAWPATVDVLNARFSSGHGGQAFRAIAFDKRLHFYALNYYKLGDSAPMYMWMFKTHPENHAELTKPLPAGREPVLLVNYYNDEKYQKAIAEDFERLVPLEPLDIDLGSGKRRQLNLWAGYGYKPTQSRH